MQLENTDFQNEDGNPVPVSFDDFNLSPEVLSAVKELGFKKPTPVQFRTYDKIIKGQDLIIMAQTGTGKTAAFGIPILQSVNSPGSKVMALILAPTRELARQVCSEMESLGKNKKIKACAVYGGASFSKQAQEINDINTAIVVGTPGRILDHVRRGTLTFDALNFLVLDEADEMLSMGFEREISEIMKSLPDKRQNLLFSATIPKDINRLAKRYMKKAEVVSVSGDEIGALKVSHFMYMISGMDKMGDLVKILKIEQPDSAILFCNTKKECKRTAEYLTSNGYNANWINSDLSQNEREKVMKNIKSGKLKFMVATDVAARGIDISMLSHVINVSFPESLEIYIHRTGRTGRIDNEGCAISLIAPLDIGNLYYLRLTYNIYPVEKHLPEKIEEPASDEMLYKKLVRDFSQFPKGTMDPLATRIIQSVFGKKIISGLLISYFDSREHKKTAAQEEKTFHGTKKHKKKLRDKNKKQSFESKSKKQPEKSKIQEQVKTKARTDKKEPQVKKKKEPEKSTGNLEIHVNAGRKDGLKISTLMKDVIMGCGLERSSVGRVKMLAKSTFLSVPQEHVKKVIKALSNIELEDRKLKAELSESK